MFFEYAPMAPFLIAGAVAVFGLPRLFRGLKNRPVEWPDAKIGVARVTALRVGPEAGDGRAPATIEVRVQPMEGGPEFSSTLTRRVPAASIHGIQEHMRFPVMFRPDRPEKVKIARGKHEIPAQRFFDHLRLREGLIDEATLRADAHGLPTTVKVLWYRGTGREIAGLPEFEFAVRVFVPGGGEYDVVKTRPLLRAEAAALVPGAILPARCIPGDAYAVAIALTARSARNA